MCVVVNSTHRLLRFGNRRHARVRSRSFAIPTAVLFLRNCYLQYTIFLSLSNKESEVWPLLSLSMIMESRERSNHCRSWKESPSYWALQTGLIRWMPEVGRRKVDENSSDTCVNGYVLLYGWERGLRVTMKCYGRMLLTLCWKKKHILYLCDNLFCKIASDDRILALLNVCVVEKHAINLNQSTSLFKK